MLQLHCEGRVGEGVQDGERENQGIWSGNEVRSDPIRSGIGSSHFSLPINCLGGVS